MKIYALASGSKGNCFIICCKDTNIMIDCRTTKKYLVDSFNRINMNIKDIDALLITHDHSDHISQIKMFKDLNIYSPVSILNIKTYDIKAFQSFDINNVNIMPIMLSHDAKNTVGYIIDDHEEKCLYMTDTGYVNDRYLSLFKDLDHIIIESNHDVEMLMNSHRPLYVKRRIFSDNGHLCNEDCANVLSKIICDNTKDVMLAHVSMEANTYDKALAVNLAYLNDHNIDISHIDFKVCRQFEIVIGGK